MKPVPEEGENEEGGNQVGGEATYPKLNVPLNSPLDATPDSLNDTYGGQRKITSSTTHPGDYLDELEKPKKPFNWRNALIVANLFVAGAFAKGLAQYGYGVFAAELEEEFETWNRTLTNGALTIGQIASAFLAPITGWVLDKYGGRSSTVMCLTAVSGGYVLLSFTTNIWYLYATYCFAFFCYIGIVRMIPGKVIPLLYPENKGVVLAIAAAGAESGGFFITPTIAFLVESYSWRPTARILAISAGVVAVVTIFVMKDWKRKEKPEELQTDEEKPLKKAQDPTTTISVAGASRGLSVSQALRWPGYYFVGFSIIAMQFHITMIASQLYLHFESFGISKEEAALMVSVSAASGMAAKFLFGRICDKTSGFKGHLAIAVTEIVGLICLYFAGGSTFGWGAAAIYGLSQGVGVTRVIFLSENVGMVAFGKLFSFILTADLLLASGPGPVIAGILFEAADESYNTVFILVGGVVVAGIISMFISRLFPPPEIEEPIEKPSAMAASEIESMVSGRPN